MLLITIGVWIIIANVLMIVYVQRLMAQPKENSRDGTYIIILSIIAGVNLLALIGGIIAVTYNPTPTKQQHNYTTICPQHTAHAESADKFLSAMR